MLQRLKLSFIAVLSVLLMAGCDSIITDPNPLIGCYKISLSEGGYSYAFGLHEDNSFEMLQYAGSDCYASIGTYAIELSSFDFKTATGYITFTVTQQDDGLGGICLSREAENIYMFTWEANTENFNRLLTLEAVSGGRDFPSYAVSMAEADYYAEREKWTGIPAPEPEIPEGGAGGEDGTEGGDGGEANE